MKKQADKLKAFNVGKKKLILRDNITNEELEIESFETSIKSKQRNKGFEMLFLKAVCPSDTRMKILFWLIKNKSNTNTIRINNAQLAKKFEVTEKTIQEIKKQFCKDKLIKYEPGYIILNPNFIWKGSVEQREKALSFWNNIKN